MRIFERVGGRHTMEKEVFKNEMHAILKDIKQKLESIDEQMKSVEDNVQQDLDSLIKSELIHLNEQKREEFALRHKHRLQELRMQPLKSAKSKLEKLYKEITNIFSGLNDNGTNQLI